MACFQSPEFVNGYDVTFLIRSHFEITACHPEVVEAIRNQEGSAQANEQPKNA